MRDMVMVVGSGMMGSGIGAMSALAGNKTVLVDLDAGRVEAGRQKAVECIRLREENGLATHEQAERAVELLATSTDSLAAAENARLVIEAIVEKVEAKQALFAQLDVEPSVRVMSKNLGMLLDLCLRGVGACFCPENMALATLTQEQLDSVERFRFSHGARFPIRIGCRRQARRWSLLSDFVDLTQQMLGEEEYQP